VSDVFILVDQEDDASNAADGGEDSEADDTDGNSSEDNLSDIDDGDDEDEDDDDDKNFAAIADNDDDSGDENVGLPSENCEPPAKKHVHFADTVEIEKSPAVTVSDLCCICIVMLVIFIIIIIIINDNVYGAVIVTMVTARVHPVHLMNAD